MYLGNVVEIPFCTREVRLILSFEGMENVDINTKKILVNKYQCPKIGHFPRWDISD